MEHKLSLTLQFFPFLYSEPFFSRVGLLKISFFILFLGIVHAGPVRQIVENNWPCKNYHLVSGRMDKVDNLCYFSCIARGAYK